MNITVFSFDDRVDFGIHVDPDLVPEPWDLAAAIGDSLIELMDAADLGVSGAGRRRVRPEVGGESSRDLGLRTSRLRRRHPGVAAGRHAQARWRCGRGGLPPRRARRRRVDGNPELRPARRGMSDTMAMSFSTTKGVIATTVHRLVDRGLIDYDEPVATYWPEFAAAGKERGHRSPPAQPLRRAPPTARRHLRRLRDARLGSRRAPGSPPRRRATNPALVTAITASRTASSSAK